MKRENTILIAAILFGIVYVYRRYFYIPISTKVGKANSELPQALVKDIESVANKYNVPANILGGMVVIESGGDPLAKGEHGEIGLLQLKRIAVDDINANVGSKINFDLLFSPGLNLIAGALYLGLQYKRMKNWASAVRAYNQGENGARQFKGFDYLTKVKKWL